jgi:hypothetical protein
MNEILSVFRIKKGEWRVALAALIVLLFLHYMLIHSYPDSFFRWGHIGYFSAFSEKMHISGFDDWSYIMLSNKRIYFITLRHPLWSTLLYPLYLLNGWLSTEMGHNCAVYIMAAINTILTIYSAIFSFRIFHELLDLKRGEACLLTAFFFSFAHVMLATIVPDHFNPSLFLLLLTLYITGRHFKSGRPMGIVQTAVLYFFTAGMTLTNGVKVMLAAWFSKGRRVFMPLFICGAFLIPSGLLYGIYQYQYEQFVEPSLRHSKQVENAMIKKDPKKWYQKQNSHHKWTEKQNGKPMTENIPILEWGDMTTSRGKTFVENLFGEGFMLHDDYLLKDVQQQRPVFVKSYSAKINYAVEALLILLLVVGAYYGRHSKLLLLPLSWFAFDMLMHMGFGFGINELYIMTSHWAFLIPVAAAFIIKRQYALKATMLNGLILLMTLYMWAYNVYMLASHCALI